MNTQISSSDASAGSAPASGFSAQPTVPPQLQALQTAPQEPPLVQRLVRDFSATWVDEASVAAWAALGGDRVVLLAGDAVRFPEGQDVAVVLPELRRCASRPFEIAVVPRQQEEAVAKRYGANRWPSLLFLRDGQYVTLLAGMHDWEVYLKEVEHALALPISRAPTVGIPVVSAPTKTGDAACH